MTLYYNGTNIPVCRGDQTTHVDSLQRVTVESVGDAGVTISGVEEDHECRMVPFTCVVAPAKIGAYDRSSQ